MKLFYRGVSYQANSLHLATVKEINAKYRGIPYQIRKVKNATIKDICVLKYRGVDYVKVLN